MLIIAATKVKQILEYIQHLKAAFEMITSDHKSKRTNGVVYPFLQNKY